MSFIHFFCSKVLFAGIVAFSFPFEGTLVIRPKWSMPLSWICHGQKKWKRARKKSDHYVQIKEGKNECALHFI